MSANPLFINRGGKKLCTGIFGLFSVKIVLIVLFLCVILLSFQPLKKILQIYFIIKTIGNLFFKFRSTKGGEISFIKQMIQESVNLDLISKTIFIYFSSMIGCKNNIKPILEELELNSHIIQAIRFRSFRQGSKTRWFVSWSFVAAPFFPQESNLAYLVRDIGKFKYYLDVSFKELSEKIHDYISGLSLNLTKNITSNFSIFEGLIDLCKPVWKRKYRRSGIENSDSEDIKNFKIRISLVRSPKYTSLNRVYITISKIKIGKNKVLYEAFINNILHFCRNL